MGLIEIKSDRQWWNACIAHMPYTGKSEMILTNKTNTKHNHKLNFSLLFPSFSFLQSLFPIPWWRPFAIFFKYLLFHSNQWWRLRSNRSAHQKQIQYESGLDLAISIKPGRQVPISLSRHWSLRRPLQTDDEEEEVPCSLSLSLWMSMMTSKALNSPRCQT